MDDLIEEYRHTIWHLQKRKEEIIANLPSVRGEEYLSQLKRKEYLDAEIDEITHKISHMIKSKNGHIHF